MLGAEVFTQSLVAPFLAGLGCFAVPPLRWSETGLTHRVLDAVTDIAKGYSREGRLCPGPGAIAYTTNVRGLDG